MVAPPTVSAFEFAVNAVLDGDIVVDEQPVLVSSLWVMGQPLRSVQLPLASVTIADLNEAVLFSFDQSSRRVVGVIVGMPAAIDSLQLSGNPTELVAGIIGFVKFGRLRRAQPPVTVCTQCGLRG